MKKIVLVILILLTISLPFQQNYMEVQAAIWSKAGSQTAKKVAKEVVQDSAINQAIKIAADTSKKLQDPSRMVKEGHMMFCMDYTYKPGDKCNKPASIKQNLTDADKVNIKKQAGTEIDKLVSPNGKGFTKWQKFLDWFVPIWLVTFAVTAITYALDPDVKSLFDEAAYNTLVALGIIGPVTDTTQPEDTDKIVLEGEFDKSYNPPKGSTPYEVFTQTFTTTKENNGTDMYLGRKKASNVIIDFFPSTLTENPANIYMDYGQYGDIFRAVFSNTGNGSINFRANTTTSGTEFKMSVAVNGTTIKDTMATTNSNARITLTSEEAGININDLKIHSVRTRIGYMVGTNYYTDVLFNTTEGLIWLQYEMYHHPLYGMDEVGAGITYRTPETRESTVQIRVGATIDKQIMPPLYENLDNEMTFTEESSYIDENGNIALLPPAAFTYVEESTGEQVERKQAPSGDGYVWQKPDGTEVPEENVIPKPEEEPRVSPSPEGTPEYTPAPTPSNPNPEPVPLTPQQPAPEPNPEPEPNPTDPTIPEGQSCSKDWEFPDFEPLKDTMSDAFPFSIPWDMQNALESAFGDIGTERPSFDLDLKFMGNEETISISMPKFFDDWKPFTDSLLLFIFDIGIMFGIYRFMKGGSS